jgi:hypothetical protein
MPEIKHPSVKADSVQRNVAGVAPEAPSRKTAKKKAAAPAKKRVTRKKAAAGEKKPPAAGKAPRGAAAAAASSSVAPMASAPKTNPGTKPALSSDARQRMISEAAYLISLKRHAGAAGPEADWLFAETVIDMVFDSAD